MGVKALRLRLQKIVVLEGDDFNVYFASARHFLDGAFLALMQSKTDSDELAPERLEVLEATVRDIDRALDKLASLESCVDDGHDNVHIPGFPIHGGTTTFQGAIRLLRACKSLIARRLAPESGDIEMGQTAAEKM